MIPFLRRPAPISSSAIRALILVAVLASFGLIVPSAGPNARPAVPAQLKALSMPPATIDASTDGVPKPLLFRSVRLSTVEEKTVVLFAGEGDVEEIQEGHTLTMGFQAPRGFTAAGALLDTLGTAGSSAVISVKNAADQEIGRGIATPEGIRGWVDLTLPAQPPGRYSLEITKQGSGRLGWVGQTVNDPEKLPALLQGKDVAFRLDQIPQYADSTFTVPAGFQAEALYFLGGLSTYDHGMSWWDDYEARGDFGDRQFIGDSAGQIDVVYEDGTVDSIPLIFGWNMWWYNHFDGPEAGGPFLEPFASDAAARATLESALKLSSFSPDPSARYFWTYLPRPKKIKELRLVDNPEKQGFPLVEAISVLTSDSAGNLTVLSGSKPASLSGSKPLPITPFDLKTSSFREPLDKLERLLYTREDSFPSHVPQLDSSLTPSIEFSGTVEAEILSNVYAVNLPDLLRKQEDSGKFHASDKGSINWGSYQGIGTWREGAAPFYDQSWARDMGRSLLELVRAGFLNKTEAGVKFADSHLYDLPNGYPTINRAGQKVPPHWTTVLGDPLYGDKDRKGDGDQANDGHGLLLLAHYRLWQQEGKSIAWLRDRWPFVRDAAEWYVFQLDNPSFSRATSVLYTESESARDGGYDVYSNFIALKALEKSSEMATALGQSDYAEKWKTYAAELKQGIARQLVVDDPRFGKTWKPLAWNWSYAHESLAPIIISADVDGFDLWSTDPEWLSLDLNTYRRQISYPGGFASPQTLGYGQSFLTQAALLLDDVDGYSKALDYLARFIYSPLTQPYLVPEGVTLHPSGKYWYRNGDLGNAVHQAEVLKTLSIVAGVDNLRSSEITLIPRLADGWTGIKVADYPANDGKTSITYSLSRAASSYNMQFRLSGERAATQVRLGPIPEGAKEISATVDGKTNPARVVSAGERLWVWLDNLPVESGRNIEIHVEWLSR